MRNRPLCMVCLFLLAIQFIRVTILQNTKDQKPSLAESRIPDESQVLCEGTVCKIEIRLNSTAVYLKDAAVSCTNQNDFVQTIENQKLKNQISEDQRFEEGKLLLTVKKETSQGKWKIGQRLRIQGTKQSFDTARNPGNFDQKSYYQKQGIHINIRTDADQIEIVRLEKEGGWFKTGWYLLQNQLQNCRNHWSQVIGGQMEETHGAMLCAVLLGEKSSMDPNLKKLYQKNGLGHLFAISGLHMSLIGMSLYQILRKSGCSFLISGISAGSILFCYLLLTGPQVSSLRAMLMFLIRMGAEITGREVDPPTSLSLTAAVLSLYQPLYLVDASFLLSFGAILGIFLLNPFFEKSNRKNKEKTKKRKQTGTIYFWIQKGWKSIWEGVGISLSVNAVLLGAVLYFYYEIPPYSLALNVFLVPLFPVVMLTGIAGIFFLRFFEPAGRIGFACCDHLLSFYDLICEIVSDLPGSRIVTGQPEKATILFYYVLLIILCILFYWKRKKWNSQKLFSVLLVCVMAGFVSFSKISSADVSSLRVTAIDVGQGDGIFIRDQKGRTYLVDGGSSDVSSVGKYRIEPFLLSQGVEKLDYVFTTHGDEDHINGIQELLEGQKLGVRIHALVLPPKEYVDEKLLKLAETARKNGTKVLTIQQGEKLGDYITCLAPAGKVDEKEGKEEKGEKEGFLQPGNEASLVLELKSGNFRMLLTGDLEGAGEEALLESGLLEKCQILKAGHHGSKNSGSETFLQTVQPQITLISAGRDNRYGHPHEETLERLEKIGSRVFSTQECGAIQLECDGEKIQIKKYL